jgi:hypothetical protein
MDFSLENSSREKVPFISKSTSEIIHTFHWHKQINANKKLYSDGTF